MVDLVGEVLLPLLGQEAEARAADDAVDHPEVPAHAAVHVVQDHTLLSHVVLDDDDTVGAKAPLAAPQELGQVLVGQVAWWRRRCGWEGCCEHSTRGLSHHPLTDEHFVLNTQGLTGSLKRKLAQKSPTQGDHEVCSWDFTLSGDFQALPGT